jgi:hypothetical protein
MTNTFLPDNVWFLALSHQGKMDLISGVSMW